MPNRNGNVPTLPDFHGKATAEAMAVTAIVVWVASLFGITVPGEVGASITVLVGGGFGFVKGTKWKRYGRRRNDFSNTKAGSGNAT